MTHGILCTLWSSDKVFSTHRAHAFWNSSPSVILTTIPCVRLSLHCSSLAVIILFPENVFYTHLVSCACLELYY